MDVDEPSSDAQPVKAIAMDAVKIITSDINEQQSSMAQSVTATVSDTLLASTLDYNGNIDFESSLAAQPVQKRRNAGLRHLAIPLWYV